MAVPPSVTVTIGNGRSGLWGHVFQGANTAWLAVFEPRIRLGAFFMTLQASNSQFFDAQIPRGAEILSATMRVQAYQNSGTGALTTPINSPERNTYYTQPLLRPFEPFRGWRRDFWSDQDIDLIDNTAGTIIQTSGGINNASWIVRQITAPGGTIANRQRMGQRFVMPVVGNSTVGSVVYQMRSQGSPIGSGRVHIMGAVSELGEMVPDENILATSDDVLLSTIIVITQPHTFTFSGANQITLTAGETYFLVFDCDYVANNIDSVHIRHQNAFFNSGDLYHYGDGVGGDWQNFPGDVDFTIGTQAIFDAQVGSAVNWAVPQFFTNQFYTTPDISSVVQNQVNSSWYEPDAGIIVSCGQPNSGTINRLWRSAASPNMPRLTVTYRPRRMMLT